MIDHLVHHLPPEIPVLSVFFEKKSLVPQTPAELIGSLLRQLVKFKTSVISSAIRVAYKENSTARPLDLEMLLKVGVVSTMFPGVLQF